MARERLLRDKEMRRNKPASSGVSALPVPPITTTFPAASARPLAPYPATGPLLSPPQQKRQAIQIAQSFRSHYVAEIRYRTEDQATIAVIRPTPTRRSRSDVPYQISVDAAGNVSISRRGDVRPSGLARLLRRGLLLGSALGAAVGVFALIL